MMRPGEILVYSGSEYVVMNPIVDGHRKPTGLIPRDFRKVPCGSILNTPKSAIAKIPRSEWKERIRDLVAAKAQLSDQRLTHLAGSHIPSRDQNGRGYSHTADTEVLTEKGWTPWPEWNRVDLLATVNLDTHLMEFQSPTESHAYEYDDEIYHSTNRRLDFGVTRNHRMIVRKWDERARTLSPHYTEQRADELGWYVGMMSAPRGFIGTELVRLAIDDDREYDGDDFLAMISLIVSDGWAGGSEGTHNQVSFCCFRPERQQAIRDLANRIGFHEQPGRPGVWHKNAPALAAWVRANCYTRAGMRSQNKRMPDIVKVASMRQIEHTLAFFGDQNHSGDQTRFYSTSKRLIDDLQELHLRIGKRGTITKRDSRESTLRSGKAVYSKECYELFVATCDRLCIDRKKHIETDRYKGTVYCATVPNGTLITRRNGSVLISGNCWAHSTVTAAILSRMNSNMPYEDLSAYAIACIIKNYRDEGGWNGESMEFLRERGCPTSKFWPQQSVSRSNDNAATWANAANFKDTEWDDIPEGDFDLQTTYNLLGMPYALDLNWWSHSICGADAVDGTSSFGVSCYAESGKLMDLAEFERVWEVDVYGDPFGTRIWNSWGDSWSALGMGVLTEAKARNNGAIALRVMKAA